MGVISPDEPRYLAIGRAMWKTGDFITPRLWGTPWFEKPPLLYWLTSAGTALHLGPELCGRLPVALLSLAFLAVMFLLLRCEFGVEAAATSSVLLATSAGWLAYSSLALTDLPLAVFFSLALLLALPLTRTQWDRHQEHAIRFLLIGACLGFAALAKGLVPIALAVPFFWFLRRWWRRWWLALGAGAFVALPWYASVYLQNGRAFLVEFFWKHHVERLYSTSLQHVQPWWYYLPVLLAALFPWTPLFGLISSRQIAWDERRRFLASCVVFGLVVFSCSLNKLPGYLLPLLPAGFALLGASIEWNRLARSFRWWLLPCALLIGLLPLIARALPAALEAGRLILPHGLRIGPTELFYMAAPLAAVLLARRSWAGMLLVLCLVAGGLFLKIVSFPILDRSVSARGTWRQIRNTHGTICNDWLGRDWAFGLAYYRGEPYPDCGTDPYDFALQSHERNTPILIRKKKL